MQKKIIVLAIASALTAPALALADVTMYGQANLSVDVVKDGVEASSNNNNQLNSNTSRAFPKPKSCRIAVKVINHLGDEVMKVFRV